MRFLALKRLKKHLSAFQTGPSPRSFKFIDCPFLKISPVCCQAGAPVGLRRFYALLRGRGKIKENSQIGK
jgi:hypothetical protein